MEQRGRVAPDELLDDAKRLREQGDLSGAALAFSRLAKDYPDDINVRFLYASVLFSLKKFSDAVSHFELVLESRPLHELSSLGLFHSLWKIGHREDAIKEASRFFDEGGESMEYRRLVRDIKRYL